MHIVVFGSLKGGVGRTYAAVATANLAARSGLKTMMVDLDIEAPGLAGFYGFELWEDHGAENKGIVPWAMDASSQLQGHLQSIEVEGGYWLDVLLTGQLGGQYLRDLLSDTWRDQFEREPANFARRFRTALSELESPPDVIVIDCRAGLTPMMGALLGHLADSFAFLFGGDRESVQVANRIRATLPSGVTMITALSRYPQFHDPSLKLIAETLKELNDVELTSILRAAPGHEGSRIASIPTIGPVQTSPLVADHVSLATRLIPGLAASASAVQRLAPLIAQAARKRSDDIKLYTGIAQGVLKHGIDGTRNVAFRVETIASIFQDVANELSSSEATDAALRKAGTIAGRNFGRWLAQICQDNPDSVAEPLEPRGSQIGNLLQVSSAPEPKAWGMVDRIRAWCWFDMSSGFGDMELFPEGVPDEVFFLEGAVGSDFVPMRVVIKQAFLNPMIGAAPVIEGYSCGVLEELAKQQINDISWQGDSLCIVIPTEQLNE
jgi:AAA domain